MRSNGTACSAARIGDPVERRRRDDAAECAGDAIAGIVGHDQQDVGRALGRHDLRRPIGLGILGVETDLAAERRRRIGQVAPVDRRRGVGAPGVPVICWALAGVSETAVKLNIARGSMPILIFTFSTRFSGLYLSGPQSVTLRSKPDPTPAPAERYCP